jgi:hypothetical protein
VDLRIDNGKYMFFSKYQLATKYCINMHVYSFSFLKVMCTVTALSQVPGHLHGFSLVATLSGWWDESIGLM